MKLKFATLAFAALPILNMSCGDKHQDQNDLSSRLSHQKKSYVFFCDGAAFDNSDPFGKRSTFAFEGTKQFKQTSDFVMANEGSETANVLNGATNLCQSNSQKIGGSVGSRLFGLCLQISGLPDFAFHTLFAQYGNDIYKGSYSCTLKEKTN
jgi:hypothetical protein